MLQVIMGADDHTASDGSYLRAIKARKWVYLAAAVCGLLANRLYVESAATELLRIVEIPYWLAAQAAGLGLAYLTLQYGLLLVQVSSIYDLELEERFAAKLKAEREAASAAVDNAASRLRDLDGEIERLQEQLDGLIPGISAESGRSALYAQFNAAQANRFGLVRSLDEASGRLLNVEVKDPAKRSLFVRTEKMIDGLRLYAPMPIAAFALIGLLLAQF